MNSRNRSTLHSADVTRRHTSAARATAWSARALLRRTTSGRGATALTLILGLMALAIALPAPAQEKAPADQPAVAAEGAEAIILKDEGSKEAWVPPMTERQPKSEGLVGGIEVDDETMARLQKRVTLNFKDEEIQNVVRLIAADAGLNVVMNSDEVTGKVTIELQDVPVAVALESILRSNSLTMIRERGGIVRVLPLSKVSKSAIETKTVTIRLDWVQAADVAKTLEVFKSDDGQIVAHADTNLLIISDAPHRVDEMVEIIKELDVPEKQVLIEARMCELTVDASRALGIQWDLATRDDDSMPISKAINLLGDAASYGQYAGLPIGNSLVGPRSFSSPYGVPGALGEPTITQLIDDNGNVQTITAMAPIPFPVFDTAAIGANMDSFGVNTPASENPAAIFSWAKEMGFLGQEFNFSTAIDMLEQRNMAKTLANPRIVTLNNQETTMEVVRRIPYISSDIGSGGSTTIDFEYEDVGIKLTVTPTVSNRIDPDQPDYVRMTIEPEQRIFIGQEGNARPTVDLRKSKTNVIVEDEQTAVVIGLRQQEFNQSMNAVPWVHRVPFFGWLFKGKSTNNLKTDLVAFVTPHVLKDPGITEEEQARYDEIDDKWDLPDYFYDDVEIEN
ncbi:secretin N-terminal domain-containing protein [Candidatus Sumerlaeota bacterium]